jgi:hypothetical protein
MVPGVTEYGEVVVRTAFSAFVMSEEGIGWPARSQASWRGVRRRDESRLLSQSLRIQVRAVVRKLEDVEEERRHIPVTVSVKLATIAVEDRMDKVGYMISQGHCRRSLRSS